MPRTRGGPLCGFETILLVDDDLPVLKVLRATLVLYGYKVLAADSGAAAVRIAEESRAPIHLLVSDVVLPDMAGPALAERLAAHHPGLPAVYFSGFADPPGLGPDAPFLRKPVSPQALARKIREVLHLRATPKKRPNGRAKQEPGDSLSQPA